MRHAIAATAVYRIYGNSRWHLALLTVLPGLNYHDMDHHTASVRLLLPIFILKCLQNAFLVMKLQFYTSARFHKVVCGFCSQLLRSILWKFEQFPMFTTPKQEARCVTLLCTRTEEFQRKCHLLPKGGTKKTKFPGDGLDCDSLENSKYGHGGPSSWAPDPKDPDGRITILPHNLVKF